VKLDGQVAVVTGGARGFGAAAADLFATEGARLVIGDLLEDLGCELVERLRARGADATFVRTDVTSAADVQRLMATALTAYGGLHILLANAGVFLTGKVEDNTEDEYERLMSVNVKGNWLACKYAIPLMRQSGGGSIVITSSAMGVRGSGRSLLYAASKGASVQLGKSIALQNATGGVRCNVICPGPVATDLYRSIGLSPDQVADRDRAYVPMGRLGTVEEVARAMLFLAGPDSGFCTGTVLAVDGGVTA
jgi:NAD(P)-dependent dehydrogenase (short-subunit alcohol dehydrogenase family)